MDRITHLSLRQKLCLFTGAIAAIFLALLVLVGIGSWPVYPLLVFAVIAIVLPLISGLFVYAGKPAKLFLFLAVFAAVSGLSTTLTITVADQRFTNTCASRGPEYNVIYDDIYFADCVGPTEQDVIQASLLPGPAWIWDGVLVVTFALIAFNLANILYMSLRFVWRIIRRSLKFLVQSAR